MRDSKEKSNDDKANDEKINDEKINDQKMCPVLASGWLANKYAADGDTTFNSDSLPKCLEEACQAWCSENGPNNPGYCRMINHH